VYLRHQRLHHRHIDRLFRSPFFNVASILSRLGLGRLRNLVPKRPVPRYEWERPGDPSLIDVTSLSRFRKLVHQLNGHRQQVRSYAVRYDIMHVSVDDTTRLAYVGLLTEDQKTTVVSSLIWAIFWFNSQGIQCRRVMSDIGPAYFAKACRTLVFRHISTRPYTRRTNGQAERFLQSLCIEWAYGISFQISEERVRRLSRYLAIYKFSGITRPLSGAHPSSGSPSRSADETGETQQLGARRTL